MRVGLIQSNFIPWRGYFDFIDDVDLFIYYDDRQFSKGSLRNRNRIKSEQGLRWVTVPIVHKCLGQSISETAIDDSQDWIGKISGQIESCYKHAPFYKKYSGEFFEILECKKTTLTELNLTLNRWIMSLLGITTEIRMSDSFDAKGTKTDRILDILRKAGATAYLSGPSAKGYLESGKFADCHIELEFKSYEYKPYPQLYGSFEPQVSVLDMLFNIGAAPKEFWKSLTPNTKEFL